MDNCMKDLEILWDENTIEKHIKLIAKDIDAKWQNQCGGPGKGKNLRPCMATSKQTDSQSMKKWKSTLIKHFCNNYGKLH